MTQHEKDLLKYLGMTANPLGFVIAGIFVALGLFFIAFVGLPGGLFAVLGVILIITTINTQKKNKAVIDSMRASGELEMLLNEYRVGKEMVGGNVIIGHQYILGKGQGAPVRYTDLVRVYQHIHKTNGVEDQRLLKGVLSNGKVKDLFTLQTKGKSDEELNQILRYILSKNPGIQIGYK